VEVAENFEEARACLDDARFDLIVSSLRLGAYNGIQLAYAVRLAELSTRVVVHTNALDGAAARDIQSAGALYEHTERLILALPGYLGASLPAMDRRNPLQFDRRRLVRGGRRAWDRRPFGPDNDAA
jgi:hypothetical protein